MAITVEVVEGWTGDLDFQLLADGAPVDLTGLDVALVLEDRNGAAVTVSGDVTVFDAANGKVRLNPDVGDLLAEGSPYRAHWKVTDGDDKSVFFPNGKPDRIIVYAQATGS